MLQIERNGVRFEGQSLPLLLRLERAGFFFRSFTTSWNRSTDSKTPHSLDTYKKQAQYERQISFADLIPSISTSASSDPFSPLEPKLLPLSLSRSPYSFQVVYCFSEEGFTDGAHYNRISTPFLLLGTPP